MSKYLKKFETHQEYEAYIQDRQNLVLPNVSFCEDTPNEVHYNPYVPQFFCKLTLNDGSIVNIEGSGELTSTMTRPYSASCVSAEIGELCTSVGSNAFGAWNNLKSIVIGKNVTSGLDNFSNAFMKNNLTSIVVDPSNTVYDSRDNCNGIIETAANALTVGCQTTVIPNGVTTIEAYAFNRCQGLVDYVVPEGVTKILDSAFDDCSDLKKLTFPSTLSEIVGSQYFPSEMDSLTILATTPPTVFDAGSNNIQVYCTAYVPANSVSAYQRAYGWNFNNGVQPIPTT